MNVIDETIIIARRFRGPPDSANGGYACGLLACRTHGDARVRLQSPPPLDRPMKITGSIEQLAMLDGDATIAQALAVDAISADVPAAVSYDVAKEATANFRWFDGHPFATCFVCGPEREPGDGLCIFPGRVPGREMVAAAWTPHSSVCDAQGVVTPEVVWATLDCPSWFGVLEFAPDARALLGQLTAHVERRPRVGEKCVVIGWSRGRDGRKLYGGAALYSAGGELLGHSEAVWIEPKM